MVVAATTCAIAAEMFEDLAGPAREQEDRRTAFQALSQAAACWSLAGYQANAVVMGDRLRRTFAAFDILAPASRGGKPGQPRFLRRGRQGSSSVTSARLESLVALAPSVSGRCRDGGAQPAPIQAEAGLGAGRIDRAHRPGELLAGVAQALRFWRSRSPAGRRRRAERRFAEAERLRSPARLRRAGSIANSAREIFADSATCLDLADLPSPRHLLGSLCGRTTCAS